MCWVTNHGSSWRNHAGKRTFMWRAWAVLTHLDKTSPPRSCHPLGDSVASFTGHPMLSRVSCSSLLCHINSCINFTRSLLSFPFVLGNKLGVTAKPHLGYKPAWCDRTSPVWRWMAPLLPVIPATVMQVPFGTASFVTSSCHHMSSDELCAIKAGKQAQTN